MTDLSKAYYEFWSSILPVYVEGTVPTGTSFPYLTYTLVQSSAFTASLQQVRVWSYSSGFLELADLCAKVSEAIPYGGVLLEGTCFMSRGTPWIQYLPQMDTDPNYKCALINVQIGNYQY